MCLKNTKFSIDLLRMAHLYQLADLFANCKKYLEENLTKENAVEVWKAAFELLGGPVHDTVENQWNYKKLEHQALDTIARVNLHDISRSFANKTLGPPIFKIALCFGQTGQCKISFKHSNYHKLIFFHSRSV